MKKKKPVLQDVANRVSVTKMTVSRLLRNPEQASVALHGKIAAAPGKLGYIPNRAPNILSNATSRAVGVLLPSLINQVFAEVLRGTESITGAHGYRTMLARYGYKPEMEQKRLKSVLSWNIGSLILIEHTRTPRTLKMIEVAGIPVVELMDSKSPRPDITAGFNNLETARQMATAIIARGHRHIAYLGAHLDERTTIKQKGYEQVVLDAGLVPYGVMVEQSSLHSPDIGLIRQAQQEYPQLDDVFCTNDDLAAGAAFECQRLRLKVPGDMAIASFHGRDIGQVMEPRLTSVSTPRERMDSIGAERLLVRIRGESVTPEVLDLGLTLLPGGSI